MVVAMVRRIRQLMVDERRTLKNQIKKENQIREVTSENISLKVQTSLSEALQIIIRDLQTVDPVEVLEVDFLEFL